MTAALRCLDLTKRYRSVAALDGVTLDLPAGVITGLLGRNGAGKTTLLQVLSGQQLPTSGSVEVLGEDPYENAPVLAQICLAREGQHYPESYRVRHVLAACAHLYPGWDGALARDLVGAFGLPLDRHVKKLSRGMVSAVSAAVGLASRAPVTMFDEPYTGLDAVARRLFYDRLLADYGEHPRTVVLSTHLIDEISDLVEHAVVIDRGRVLLAAPAQSLRQDALAVSGPKRAVDILVGDVADLNVLHHQEVAGTVQATLTGAASGRARHRARQLGLDTRPVSLQELFVRTTTTGAAAPVDGRDPSPDLAAAGREKS